MELDEAVEDLEPLSFLLGRLLDELCARLAARSLSASAIHLRFDLGDLFEYEAVPGVVAPHVGKTTEKIYCKTLTLPVAMRDSKLLLKLMRLQLQSNPPPGSIVKIALAADPARQRFAQSGLFVPSSPDPEKLELVLARIAKLVGEPNVGSAEVVDTHRPGAFRMIRFASSAKTIARRARCARRTPSSSRRLNRSSIGPPRRFACFDRLCRRVSSCATAVPHACFSAACAAT